MLWHAGHPTSLLSPDWPGATRVAMEEEVGGVCVFVLGACGATACIQAHQGDPAVTERDGRRVGLAACSALGSLPPDGGVQLEYSGPIISGAVIGQWSPAPFSAEAVKNASAFRSKELAVSVPMRPMESAESAKANLDEAEARLAAAQEVGTLTYYYQRIGTNVAALSSRMMNDPSSSCLSWLVLLSSHYRPTSHSHDRLNSRPLRCILSCRPVVAPLLSTASINNACAAAGGRH